MRRTILFALALLLTNLTLATHSLAAADAAKNVAELQGKWKLTAVEVNERQAGLPGDLPVWEIKDGKVLYGPEELATLVVDGSVTPKTIDLQFVSPAKTYEGIYSVEGETLRICVNNVTDGVKQRPAELATKDQPGFRLLTFKRAAADDAGPTVGFVGMALKLSEETKEVMIFEIIEGSPAKKADLKEGDILLQVAGVKATDLQSTVDAVRKVKPSTDLAITLRRDGKEQEVTVKAGVFPFRLFGILD
jgi:uncharacterized protein (TIGR03067 family)